MSDENGETAGKNGLLSMNSSLFCVYILKSSTAAHSHYNTTF